MNATAQSSVPVPMREAKVNNQREPGGGVHYLSSVAGSHIPKSPQHPPKEKPARICGLLDGIGSLAVMDVSRSKLLF